MWIALALAALTLGACGEEGSEPPPDVTAAEDVVVLVDETEADLVLVVSNQSLDDEEVRLTVEVDGVPVVDDQFHVEDQHNWVRFPLDLTPGAHEVTAESDTGATLHESFEVEGGKRAYAILEHWTEDDSAATHDPPVRLTWQLQHRAPAFG